MVRPRVQPTGRERTFAPHEIIVSKTDPKGIITYANQTFIRISGYSEHELLGAPHNLIRHPDMPRCVFKLLWDTIEAGEEIFAYVVNLCKNGDHYWVFAHVTPSFDDRGTIIGYHSSRRVPDRNALEQIEPIYRELKRVEDAHTDSRRGMQASFDLMLSKINSLGVEYDEFVFSVH